MPNADQPVSLRDDAQATSPIGDLFSRHADALRRMISRALFDRQEVEDVVQESYLRIWRKYQAGELRPDARAYMFQIAMNLAIDRNRQHRVRGPAGLDPALADSSPDQGPDAEDATHWRQGMAHLESALAELPPLTRSVFLLFHFDKLSVPTIAARTSLSTRTIERHLARALAHCAEQIEPFL